MIKIVAISDLHGTLPDIPACDLLLIGGDICPVHNHSIGYQLRWVNTEFREWLEKLKAKHIVGTFGNHDFIAQTEYMVWDLPGHWLIDNWVHLYGFKIWGTPFTPTFFDWAFMEDDAELAEHWAKIPDDVNILLTHGPPYGTCDVNDTGEHCGSKTLRDRVKELHELQYHFCGHIHEANGYGYDDKTYNVSHMNLRYEPVNPPLLIEIE